MGILESRRLLLHAIMIAGLSTRTASAQDSDTNQNADKAASTQPESDSTLPTPRSDNGSTKIETQSNVDEKVERNSKTDVIKDKISGTGFGFFGGADLGIVYTLPSSKLYKSIESSQFGLSPTLKFAGSVFTKRIILDLGLGLNYARYRGTLIALPTVDDFGDLAFNPINSSYTNDQTTLLIESAGRLRINPTIQIGLLGTILYSTKSAGFSSIPDIEPPEKYVALVGPQFVYESKLGSLISRMNASLTVSLTGSNRTTYLATFGAGLGSFVVNPVATVKTKSETKYKTKVTREIIPLKVQSADVTENVSFIFDSQMINFKLNSAELNPKSSAFITALGEMFKREQNLWTKLLIEGHTDSRGSEAYNLKLSAKRARSVLNQLEITGLPRGSLESVGLGATRLLVNPEVTDIDYARNRRVEIRMLGLKNSRSMQKYVDEIQTKFFGKPVEFKAAPVPQKIKPEDRDSEKQSPVWDPGLDSQENKKQ